MSAEAAAAPVVSRDLPCPLAHLVLCAAWIAPLLVHVPANFNVILTASLAVYVGAARSVKPTPPAESMTKKDAMKFPLVGSAVLFSLFLLFKFLPKELVNAVLTAYFMLLGTFAVTASVLPFVEVLFSKKMQDRTFELRGFKVPYFMKEPLELAATVPELVAGCASLGFCAWYYAQRHWLANNALGLAFSLQGIEHLSLGAVQTGVILLCGLFAYDIFWVFCTPVMVSVAKSFDAPIKLLFPRPEAGASKMPFSMLGLGDIVIPGIFVALILRFDYLQGYKTRYFRSAFAGYVGGLGTTILVMNLFQAAQPALLYIVPAVLGATLGHAALAKDFARLFGFDESAKEEGAKGEGSGKAAAAAEGAASSGAVAGVGAGAAPAVQMQAVEGDSKKSK